MNRATAHRGPDGEGIFEDREAGVALGHVRLAILDLTSSAAQPMHSSCGRYVLSYNGEIYNYRELRSDLVSRGHSFRSSGDTEVLLNGLAEYGLSFLDRLDGMFAFALWDRRERQLLLVRDQLGIKPLYYAEPNLGELLFSSEIKSLCVHPGLKREPDFVALQQHLAYCYASGERTALAGVKRLLPGHWLRWRASDRKIEIRRYWRSGFGAPRADDRGRALPELRDGLRRATVGQMVSDVPVGSFLSGGLDSSLLTTLAGGEAGSDFRCYTVTYPQEDNRLDGADADLPHARRLAGRLGLSLKEIELKPDVAELWPRLIHHLDEPIADPAAIACFLVCQLAKEDGTKVLLSGQGADELFCGYPRYMVMHSTGWMHGLPLPVRRLLVQGSGLLPGAMEGRAGAMMRRVRRALAGLEKQPEQRFLDLCANTPQAEISRVLSPAFKAELGGQAFGDDCLQHMEQEGLDGLQRLQERDLSIYLPNHNLLYTDKMGMAVGVEARVPLLDIELVNEVTRYPHDWLLNGRETKVLFREATRGIVPDSIIDRPKAGFGAPYRKWLRYDLEELWNEVTSERAVKERGWFDHAALQDARRRSQEGKSDLYMLQWAVLTIELWARQFIDRDPSAVVRRVPSGFSI